MPAYRSAESLESDAIGTVVYVGRFLRSADPYKRVRGGWRRFYLGSLRAFGPTRTSQDIANEGAHP